MRKTLSVVVFCFAAIFSLAIYDAYTRVFNQQPNPVTSFPKVTVSKFQLSRLDFVRDTLRNAKNRGRFQSWQHVFNNQVEQYIGTIADQGITYQLVAFPDGLLLTTDAGIANGKAYMLFDKNYDGTVDVGSYQDVSDGTETKKFDIAISEGMNHQGFYQEIYNRGMIRAGDILGY